MRKTLWIAAAAMVLPVAAFAGPGHDGSQGARNGVRHEGGEMMQGKGGEHRMMKGEMRERMKQQMRQCMESGSSKEDCMARHKEKMQEHKKQMRERMKDKHDGEERGHMKNMRDRRGDAPHSMNKDRKTMPMKRDQGGGQKARSNDGHRH
jgi:hypothetical protein